MTTANQTALHAPCLEYYLRFSALEEQRLDVELRISKLASDQVELMMARWSPGFYKVEDYASRVVSFRASNAAGEELAIERPKDNRWRIATAGSEELRFHYSLLCKETSVTTNWVAPEYAILNGPATFIGLIGAEKQVHKVIIELPEQWAGVWSGLSQEREADRRQAVLLASDFDTLLDSPLLLGNPQVGSFEVAGKQHTIAAVGELGDWDMERACKGIAPFVAENARFWNGLPYSNYSFLLVFRKGGGGLEHANSTLVTANPERMVNEEGYSAILTLICHEYFHVFNVKRLRPIELGPFDYEDWPRPTSLWISEGLTCYYTDLLQRRANMRSQDWLLQSLTRVVSKLQNAPGRLLQSLEESSANVWNNSLSGINPSDDTVSYYDKGYVVGWLLDARIRRANNDQRSLDDVMRLAYQRFGGERGFEHREFWALCEEVSGLELQEWLSHAICSATELDYQEALEWFGLQIQQIEQEKPVWKIGLAANRTEAQAAHFAAWQHSEA